MTYRIFVSDDRIDYLVNELGDRVKVLDKRDQNLSTTAIEINIEDSMDALNLFHAGIRCGLRY